MTLWSVIGLLFTVAIFAAMPISPQVTQHGVELSVDQAQAATYGRYRRVTRRAYRRGGYAAAAGLAAAAPGHYGADYHGGYYAAPFAPEYYGRGYFGGYYGAPRHGFTYSRQPVGRTRLCFVSC